MLVKKCDQGFGNKAPKKKEIYDKMYQGTNTIATETSHWNRASLVVYPRCGHLLTEYYLPEYHMEEYH